MWEALAIIIPSFFGLVTTIILAIFYKRIGVLHKTINSGLTIRVEEALQSGIYKGVAQEKEDQRIREDKKVEDTSKNKK